MGQESGRTDQHKSNAPISRRQFARSAALVTTAAATIPASLIEHAAAATLPAPQEAATKPSLGPQSRAEVDAKIQSILESYGERLSDAQKAEVRRLVTEMQTPLEKLRAYPLGNGDVPATVLKPIVDRAKPQPATSAKAKPKAQG